MKLNNRPEQTNSGEESVLGLLAKPTPKSNRFNNIRDKSESTLSNAGLDILMKENNSR
jgi:hypothetical protein